jgi:hypothetical protein
MMARKFLAAGGRSPFSGTGWPLPCGTAPGEWIVVEGELAPCSRGVHVCRDVDLAYWIHDELWDVEVDGAGVEGVDCLLFPRARLVARIDAWTEKRGLFAEASIAHAQAILGPTASESLREMLADASMMAAHGYASLASYTVAVAVGRRGGADVVEGFRAERAWQSSWITDHVGRAAR